LSRTNRVVGCLNREKLEEYFTMSNLPQMITSSQRASGQFATHTAARSKCEPSAINDFVKDKPFFTTGIVLSLGILAYRVHNVRRQPHYLRKMYELCQYRINTRLYSCGALVAGGNIEMAKEILQDVSPITMKTKDNKEE